MNHKKNAFTLVELLVVISIIALLVSILMPAMGKIRTQAKVAGLKATFHSMTMGLEQFQNDNGNYPPSGESNALDDGGPPFATGGMDTGSHRLVEALAGIDMLGYASNEYYDIDGDGYPKEINGIQRKGPYVPVDKIDSINFRNFTDAGEKAEWYAKVNFQDPLLINNPNPVFVDNFKPGRPRAILYFKANKREKLIDAVFNFTDNRLILQNDMLIPYDIPFTMNDYKQFPYFLWDIKTGTGTTPLDRLQYPSARPYNRDSFILWSAGPDGEYGTEDDVTNFDRK